MGGTAYAMSGTSSSAKPWFARMAVKTAYRDSDMTHTWWTGTQTDCLSDNQLKITKSIKLFQLSICNRASGRLC